MKHQVPLSLAVVLIILSFSSCIDNRQSAGNSKSATSAVSPAPSPEAKEQTPSDAEPVMLKGPNAVPKDTRIIVNIPAFRMDVFRDGTLLRSYKVGIGYQQFPLPTGFRKAEQIIFNPTWTQPDEAWASDPGSITPAGAADNPLGPIKIPIGGANLIHGGKALAKIGTFASHGCVGLTNDEVKDFVKTLADAAKIELTDETIANYLKHRTRTQVVKLPKPVPVELRYETIVIQDGQLHIYRDVYNKNTNTEENLRAAFEAAGISFDKLSEDEKTQALDAVNMMSLHPKRMAQPKPSLPANANAEDRKAAAAQARTEAQRQAKLRSQKEIVIDISELTGKGYPAAKDLQTGAGTVASNAGAPPLPKKRQRSAPSPEPQTTPAKAQPSQTSAPPKL
ncbi:MAG TPA: L,D-transpeptidase [Pyrinomonadaceae bacterium]|nr:L,D-transpeptidase [Pyrinomonadaceae bacterium]